MASPDRTGVTVKLSVMMFLQFFLWGAWFVTLGPFMGAKGFSSTAIGNAYSTAPIAAILSPVLLGMVADRFFASQVVMGVLHVVGGLLLFLAPSAAQDASGGGWLFIGVLLAHMLCYMPTLGLSNTVAFHAMTTPEKQFPLIRVWGTIGWIVAGFVVGLLAQRLVGPRATPEETEAARAASHSFFYVAGGSGVLLGLFSFLLPHTPPPLRGKPFKLGSALGLDALSLLKDRNFLVFMGSSLLVCIPLAAYYQAVARFAGAVGIEGVPIKMTYGQMSEILFMLVMPFFFARLGVKWMLAVGMAAWVLRYFLFAGAWDGAGTDHVKWMVLAGIILHGICYDFFFVTGQIYTEQKAPKEIRAQAQGFLVFVTQGVGMLIGHQVFGRLVDHYTTRSVGPAGEEITTVDWQTVWTIPAVFALVVLVLFVIVFRDGKRPGGSESARPA
jgi:nucleoside transporter